MALTKTKLKEFKEKFGLSQDKILNGLTILLVIIALVVGYKIYKTSSPSIPEDLKLIASTPSTSAGNFADDVLITPSQSDSDEKKKQYEDLVRSKSEEALIIKIDDCKPTPLVTRVKNKQPLTIKNDSDKDHSFVSYDGKEIQLLKGKETKIEISYGSGPGIYAYGCDKSSSPVGILLVE